MTPYTVYPGTTVILDPRYCGSIEWYAAMAAHEHCIVDYRGRFNKRNKLTHRATIADVNGPLDLTFPISHSGATTTDGKLRWSDILLSTHDEWWNIHRVAMESAYGRTPFFEFYIDRFLPAWTPGVVERMSTLESLDTFIDSRIREILGIEPDVATPVGELVDMRVSELPPTPYEPYWQVRSAKLGFIPSLSILDLIFNLGPEACLWLRNHIGQ